MRANNGLLPGLNKRSARATAIVAEAVAGSMLQQLAERPSAAPTPLYTLAYAIAAAVGQVELISDGDGNVTPFLDTRTVMAAIREGEGDGARILRDVVALMERDRSGK